MGTATETSHKYQVIQIKLNMNTAVQEKQHKA